MIFDSFDLNWLKNIYVKQVKIKCDKAKLGEKYPTYFIYNVKH